MTYAYAGIAAVALIGIVALVLYLNHAWAKNQGKSEQQAESSTAALNVEKDMAKAAADAPADLKSVEDAARRGEF